ncbi:ABC transporter ATP-binding protein [Paenibacillus assamensis]|uniref:ABC transporter ATP-binding protein n=1 Tax=Paenibacillus assamensis TaxID=311244 RepID=UPI000410A5AD|nr:ABC transporter ATP-binding protein [Paenibacillus assamensis]
MSILKVDQILKRFNQHVAVDHLSFQLEEGEIYGLLGPNGAGKSTTIQMIVGLLPIDQGDIWVAGHSVKNSPLRTKASLGLVPQDLALYEQISARDNVLFFGKLYGLKGKQLQEQTDEALARVGLTERQYDKPASYSGGMKRRLNIACAIAHRPRIIIMDEPTVGIDPHSRNHILESVRKLNEDGSTIIYTSHYMEEVSAISTRIGIMNEGRLIAQGTEEELRQQIGSDDKVRVEFFPVSDQQVREAVLELKRHPSVLQVTEQGTSLELILPHGEESLQDILFILSKHAVPVRTIRREQPSLETLFLTLTGRQLRD